MRDKKHGSSVKKQSGRYRQRYKQVMLNRFIFAGIIIIKSNFKHSFEKTINQNIDSHTL